MKIEFSDYDLTGFITKHGMFCGVPAILITPEHIGVKFTQHNSIFRSSIWDLDGNLISASFKKFVNWGENTDNFPTPESLNKTTIVEKIDGSAVIIDYINGVLSMRTRGTFSVITMENAVDFELCLNKYPKISEWLKNNSNYSLITEITTPNLRIVIRYGDEPDFWLTGAINKDDYSLMTQTELDKLAKELGMVRPETYTFSTISDLLENVDKWKGKEGVCLYSNKDQTIHKIKASDYLCKHRLKEEFCNFERVLDFYIAEGCPEFGNFQTRVSQVTDWETATEIVGDISRCVDAWKEVQSIKTGVHRFIDEKLKPLGNPFDRKDRGKMAQLVLSSYGNTNRASFVFKLLDGKELDKDDLKKLFYQVLKK